MREGRREEGRKNSIGWTDGRVERLKNKRTDKMSERASEGGGKEGGRRASGMTSYCGRERRRRSWTRAFFLLQTFVIDDVETIGGA